MPRHNSDADIKRVLAKYGGKFLEKKPKFKAPFKRATSKWQAAQIYYLRWRKTPDFEKWYKKQFLKQGGTCYYCHEILPGIKVNVEHVVPKSAGGGSAKRNLVLACWPCNKAKGAKLLTEQELTALRIKNKQKKGTYLRTMELYPSETELALRLRESMRDEL